MQQYNRTSAGFYENSKGNRIAVKAVNRDYTGRRKKPVYFMSQYNRQTKKFDYMSGLFSTREDRVFSWDIKDTLGIKTLQICQFSAGGETLTLMTADQYKLGGDQ